VKNETDPIQPLRLGTFEAGMRAAAINDLPGYGQGAAVMGSAFGAGLANEVPGVSLEHSMFPSVLTRSTLYRTGQWSHLKNASDMLYSPVLTHKIPAGGRSNGPGWLGSIP